MKNSKKSTNSKESKKKQKIDSFKKSELTSEKCKHIKGGSDTGSVDEGVL